MTDLLPTLTIGIHVSEESADVLMRLERNMPRLSDEDVERIAKAVAERVVQDKMPALPPPQKAQWSDRLKDFIYGLAVGILANAAWAGIVYASSFIRFFDGEDERTEEQRNSSRQLAFVRQRIRRGTEPLDYRDDDAIENDKGDEAEVDSLTYLLSARLTDNDELCARLLQMPDFNAYIAAVKKENERRGIGFQGGISFDEWTAMTFKNTLLYDLEEAARATILNAQNGSV